MSENKLLSASIAYTFGDLLTLGVNGFLLIPVYLRFMSPEEYGTYNTVTTMIIIVGAVMTFGFHSSFARYYFIFEEQNRQNEYLGSLWLFQSFLSLIIAIIALLFGKFIWSFVSPEVPFDKYFIFVLLGSILSFSSGIYCILLRLQNKAALFVKIQIAMTISFVFCVWLLLVKMNLEAVGVIGASLIVSALYVVLSVIALKGQIKWNLNYIYIKDSLYFGFWMMLATFGFFLLNRSQIFILQHYAPLSKVGILGLGLQLSSILILFSNSFNKAYQPLIYSCKSDDQVREAVLRPFKYYLVGTVYFVLGVTILSKEILSIIAPNSYSGADVIFQLLVLANFCYIMTTFSTNVLLYKQRSDIVQTVIWLSLGVNFLISLFLVPKWQEIGSAMAMVVSFLVYLIINIFLSQRQLKIKYDWSSIINCCLIAILLYAVGNFIEMANGMIFKLIGKGIILAFFPLIVIFVKFFDQQELEYLYSLWKPIKYKIVNLFRFGTRYGG